MKSSMRISLGHRHNFGTEACFLDALPLPPNQPQEVLDAVEDRLTGRCGNSLISGRSPAD